MLLTEENFIFRGIRPLSRLGDMAQRLMASDGLLSSGDDGFAVIPPDPWPGDAAQGRDMIAGVFRFAGQTIAREALSWEPLDASPEWVSALHGFDWLRNLRGAGGERARLMARDMVARWMAQYKKYDALTWRPDIAGTRLKAWISLHDFFCASADDDFRKAYFASIRTQAKALHKALPGKVSGLSLMQAARGLAVAGLALDEEEYLEKSFGIILPELHEQVLPDGGHASRNPEAALEFFRCLIDLRAGLNAARLEVPEDLQYAIDRMAPALRFFRHADGGLALFNGGREGSAQDCETALAHAGLRGRPMPSLPHSGYERLAQGRGCLIMDVGLPPASGHNDRAHAGIFSFEYSFGRERIIVNCGTSSVAGKWRRVLRSTLAHSTLSVENCNACRLEDDGLTATKTEVRAQKHEDASTAMIEGSHGGYLKKFGLVHHRIVQMKGEGDSLRGTDRLMGKAGARFGIRFHLHPDMEAEKCAEGVRLISPGGGGWIFTVDEDINCALEESVYAGTGDGARPCLQIVLSGETAGETTTVCWELRRERI